MREVSTAEDLLARVGERDAGALGELYDSFAPILLGMLLRILSDRSAAEEVLDEVFLRLWTEAPRFGQERSSVAARLVVMARNAATERARARRASEPLDPRARDFLRTCLTCLPLPNEISALERRRDLLRKAMKQLPEPQRQALELAVFDGYTEVEIAQKLGEPLGRARTGLRAAMRFLRHRLRAILGTWGANI